MIVDFLNPDNKLDTIDQNQSELINWYLVEDKANGMFPLYAAPCPGLVLFSNITGSVVRGLFQHKEKLYAVVDNKLKYINSSGVATDLGTLTTSTGRVYFAGIDNQFELIDGTNGYNYNTDTSTFTQISDVDFTNTATTLTAQDEYFIFTKPTDIIFFLSDLSDGLSFNALEFGAKTGNDDNLVRVLSSQRELFLFGERTTEVYYNSGSATDTFLRRDGVFIEYGLAAPAAASKGDNTIFFLGKSKSGYLQVFRLDQYRPMVISNRGINAQLNSLTTTSDAFSYVYQLAGHEFYVLTFPTEGKTFVYDITTDAWHKRESYVGGVYTRHISNCYASCYGKALVGDYQSGKIYYYSNSTYTENGTAIRRTLVTHPFYKEGKQITGDRLELVFETGVGASTDITLQISKDRGHTFSTITPTRNIGGATDYGIRVLYDRLGNSRQFTFKLTTTMTSRCALLGAVGDFRIGAN